MHHQHPTERPHHILANIESRLNRNLSTDLRETGGTGANLRRPTALTDAEPAPGQSSFADRFDAGLHFLLANGYTGQTLETLQLPGETNPFERIVGVRKASYAGITLSYHFRRENQ